MKDKERGVQKEQSVCVRGGCIELTILVNPRVVVM